MPDKRRNNVMVYYDWNDFGYTVEVIDTLAGTEIEVYSAGNNKNSSADGDSVDPQSPNATSRKWLRIYAVRTAKEMVAEHNAYAMERDTSLRNDNEDN